MSTAGWSAAASAGSGIGGPLIGGLFSRQGQIEANNASRESAQKQQDFQFEQSTTAWQRGVADMRSAGLNPALAYGQGPSSAMGGASYTASNPNHDLGESLARGTNSAMDAIRLRREGPLQEAQVKATDGAAAMSAASAAQAMAQASFLAQQLKNAAHDEHEKAANADLWKGIGASGKLIEGIGHLIPFGSIAGSLLKKAPIILKGR